MARLPLLCLSLLLLLCGCAPKDPLDRKVKAGTPEEFAQWWDRTQEKFPDDQRQEVYRLLRYLQDNTPRLKSMQANDHYDPLCKRINDLRVRDVMVLAYEDKNDTLRNRLLVETGKLPNLINAISQSDTDPDMQRYAESVLDYTRRQIDSWTTQIAANDRRIAELNFPSPAAPKP